ncbi:MAG: sugar kinase [Candidatus Heimdallarchaeota archaeon]|nr:sugar kinase [Candidatus Heimdallarchaeota archaeon]
MVEYDKVVIITQKTPLDELVEYYNTKEQAKFYIEHMGGSFADYINFHKLYYEALKEIKQIIPSNIKTQIVDKSFLPSFLFNTTDLVIVLGRDGLVINTSKYLEDQPLVGINPDPQTIEGILLKFSISKFRTYIKDILDDKMIQSKISLAQADLNNQQSIIGVNDIFIGHQSHKSARYRISFDGNEENHSSSGIVVSTGIGSTGWFKSIVSSANKLISQFKDLDLEDIREEEYAYPWNMDTLVFCVREPWTSINTGNNIIFGYLQIDQKLKIESMMSEGGVIFTDGIEHDNLSFNSGIVAKIGLSRKKVNLIGY